MTDDALHIGQVDEPRRVIRVAAGYGLPAAIVETERGPRVLAQGADSRPAWLDTVTDVRYLVAELTCPGPLTVTTRDPRRWARNHDQCADCGTTARRHRARGLCSTCWDRHLDRGARLGRNPGRPPAAHHEPERTAA